MRIKSNCAHDGLGVRKRSATICLFISTIVSGVASDAQDISFSFDELVQGMLMRDSLTDSLTLDYTTTSSFPSGETGVLERQYGFVYRDDRTYMETRHRDENAEYLSRAAFDMKAYMNLDMNNRKADIVGVPPWGNMSELRTFFRLGLQQTGEPLMGEWFRERGGSILEKRELDGHTVYVVSDGGVKQPPALNGVGYVTWISPEHGFSPVRVYEYRRGNLHHLWEYKEIHEQEKGFYAPRKSNIWYFDVGEKISDFDPETRNAKWLARIDVGIQEYTYNKREYPDSFFELEIPQGFDVHDALVGLNYTVGKPISEDALLSQADTLKRALGGLGFSEPDASNNSFVGNRQLEQTILGSEVKDATGIERYSEAPRNYRVWFLGSLFVAGIAAAALINKRNKRELERDTE